jgi:hypothetical protein
MPQITDGMPVTLLRRPAWRKSSHSNPSGDCVEFAELVSRKIVVRNSRYPGGPALIFTRAEMATFIQAVEQGEFDEAIGGLLGPDGQRHAGVSDGLAAVHGAPSVVLHP